MAVLQFLMMKMLLILLTSECSNATPKGCVTSIGACVQDWIQWEDNFYKVIMTKMTWFEARDTCAEMGGAMATPKSDNEGQFLAKVTEESDERYHFWINCNDLTNEGTWECDGKKDPPYVAWIGQEPNDDGITGEDCGVTYTGGTRWGDIPCASLKRALCKKLVPMLHL